MCSEHDKDTIILYRTQLMYCYPLHTDTITLRSMSKKQYVVRFHILSIPLHVKSPFYEAKIELNRFIKKISSKEKNLISGGGAISDP